MKALAGIAATQLIACESPTAPSGVPLDHKRYLALGDSITARRPNITTYTERMADVVRQYGLTRTANAGLPGGTTRSLLIAWEAVTNADPFGLVTFMMGTNDHYILPGQTSADVSLSAFRDNVRRIHDRMLALPGAPTIVFMTAPFMVRLELNLRAYSDAVLEFCASRAIPCVDQYAVTRKLVDVTDDAIAAQRWAERFTDGSDGIHPNTAAHAAMFDALVPVVQKALAHAV